MILIVDIKIVKTLICVCGLRRRFYSNSSAKRHRGIVHQDNCLIVRHTEYVAGRASGLYPEPRPPRMLRKRKIIKFQHENNDNNTQLQQN
jgi:hypothetical protein